MSGQQHHLGSTDGRGDAGPMALRLKQYQLQCSLRASYHFSFLFLIFLFLDVDHFWTLYWIFYSFLYIYIFSQEACGILAPELGIPPAYSALGGKVLTTGQPENSPLPIIFLISQLKVSPWASSLLHLHSSCWLSQLISSCLNSFFCALPHVWPPGHRQLCVKAT